MDLAELGLPTGFGVQKKAKQKHNKKPKAAAATTPKSHASNSNLTALQARPAPAPFPPALDTAAVTTDDAVEGTNTRSGVDSPPAKVRFAPFTGV